MLSLVCSFRANYIRKILEKISKIKEIRNDELCCDNYTVQIHFAAWIFCLWLLVVLLKLIIPLSNFSEPVLLSCLPTFSLLILSILSTSLLLPRLFTSLLLLSLFISLLLPLLFNCLLLFLLLEPRLAQSADLSCSLAISFLLSFPSSSLPLILVFFPNRLRLRLLPWLPLPLRSLPASKESRFTNFSFRVCSAFLCELFRCKLLWLSLGISGRGSVGGMSSGGGRWVETSGWLETGNLKTGSLLVSVLWKSRTGQAHAPWHPFLQYVVTGSSCIVLALVGSFTTSWEQYK